MMKRSEDNCITSAESKPAMQLLGAADLSRKPGTVRYRYKPPLVSRRSRTSPGSRETPCETVQRTDSVVPSAVCCDSLIYV